MNFYQIKNQVIVSRVFKLKLKSITNDLFVKGVLERVVAHIHVIKFQKRGLSHVHILMILILKINQKLQKILTN